VVFMTKFQICQAGSYRVKNGKKETKGNCRHSINRLHRTIPLRYRHAEQIQQLL
jgi:hypothetical protein